MKKLLIFSLLIFFVNSALSRTECGWRDGGPYTCWDSNETKSKNKVLHNDFIPEYVTEKGIKFKVVSLHEPYDFTFLEQEQQNAWLIRKENIDTYNKVHALLKQWYSISPTEKIDALVSLCLQTDRKLVIIPTTAGAMNCESGRIYVAQGGYLVSKEHLRQSTNYNSAPNVSNQGTNRVQKIAPTTTKVTIDDAKSQCEELGFTPKTEKFGECVLELTK